MNWFLGGMKKYATFSGRAQRKEYWYFVLWYLLLSVVLAGADIVLGLYDEASGVGPLSALFALATLLPSLAVSARRLQDIGRSAWWLLIGLVPLIGSIVFIVFAATDGDAGPNAYGPDPKTAAA